MLSEIQALCHTNYLAISEREQSYLCMSIIYFFHVCSTTDNINTKTTQPLQLVFRILDSSQFVHYTDKLVGMYVYMLTVDLIGWPFWEK